MATWEKDNITLKNGFDNNNKDKGIYIEINVVLFIFAGRMKEKILWK